MEIFFSPCLCGYRKNLNTQEALLAMKMLAMLALKIGKKVVDNKRFWRSCVNGFIQSI